VGEREDPEEATKEAFDGAALAKFVGRPGGQETAEVLGRLAHVRLGSAMSGRTRQGMKMGYAGGVVAMSVQVENMLLRPARLGNALT
jgi:hypothetical protein